MALKKTENRSTFVGGKQLLIIENYLSQIRYRSSRAIFLRDKIVASLVHKTENGDFLSRNEFRVSNSRFWCGKKMGENRLITSKPMTHLIRFKS